MSAATSPSRAAPGASRTAPRVGFLGTGWIGRDRLRAIAEGDAVEIVALADPAPECLQDALTLAPTARPAAGLDELLACGLDGLVIATPSALHAEQALSALSEGIAVFCQKPLGRDAAEVAAVLSAAERADVLLGVDLSYRFTAAARAVREQVRSGAIGPVHAVDLTFHNAYGPDKPWFLDPALAGGGCLIDLGTHLIDLLLWTLDFPALERAAGRLWRAGSPAAPGECEDMCLATLDLSGGAVARLACSWFSHEGRDAVIEATFRGRDGAASLHNLDGSFYELAAELRRGTDAEQLAAPPDPWPGRAAADWAFRLASGERFDPSCRHLLDSAVAIDRLYGR